MFEICTNIFIRLISHFNPNLILPYLAPSSTLFVSPSHTRTRPCGRCGSPPPLLMPSSLFVLHLSLFVRRHPLMPSSLAARWCRNWLIGPAAEHRRSLAPLSGACVAQPSTASLPACRYRGLSACSRAVVSLSCLCAFLCTGHHAAGLRKARQPELEGEKQNVENPF
jgi:hypothetical protein